MSEANSSRGGPTESRLVAVVDAWVDGAESFRIIYIPPWGDSPVGLRRTRLSPGRLMYPDYYLSEEMSPEDFGRCVADWDVGEPMAPPKGSMSLDSKGVYWWGDI